MLLRWPAIVRLAADLGAQIKAAAKAPELWQIPCRSRYADLLLDLLARPTVQEDPARFNRLCDRLERVMASIPTTAEDQP